jgi:molybdopterin converting factor small subunit
MATLRLFGPAREQAGIGSTEIPGRCVGAVLAEAETRFGTGFAQVVRTSHIWVNGNPAESEDLVRDDDEVAIIPPVSGG